MLKPSAAPSVNHCSRVSATVSGVPHSTQWPRAAAVRLYRSRSVMPSLWALASMVRANPCEVSGNGRSGTGPSSGNAAMSWPSRVDSIFKALVGVTKPCRVSSFCLASASVPPRMGMTPGSTDSAPGSRPNPGSRAFNPA